MSDPGQSKSNEVNNDFRLNSIRPYKKKEERVDLNADIFSCVFEFMSLDNTLLLGKCLSKDISRKIC